MFGSYDTNNDMIEKFKKDFGSQIFVRRLIISINEGHPNYISAPGGLLLKSGEGVLLNTNGVTLSQQSTKTSYYHGGVSVKVSKHVRVGGGKSTPVKENYEKVLDTGSLCLTNSRLIFIGRDKTATIELNKIVNLEFYSNALYVTKDGVQKTFHFSGVDGNMYQGVISALRR